MNLAEKMFLRDKHDKLPKAELARFLATTEEQIDIELAKMAQEEYEAKARQEKPAVVVPETKAENDTPLLKAFGRRAGATVMTNAASQIADELQKNKGSKDLRITRPDCVRSCR